MTRVAPLLLGGQRDVLRRTPRARRPRVPSGGISAGAVQGHSAPDPASLRASIGFLPDSKKAHSGGLVPLTAARWRVVYTHAACVMRMAGEIRRLLMAAIPRNLPVVDNSLTRPSFRLQSIKARQSGPPFRGNIDAARVGLMDSRRGLPRAVWPPSILVADGGPAHLMSCRGGATIPRGVLLR